MNIDQVHPELRTAIRLLPPLPFHNRFFLGSVNLFFKLIPARLQFKGVTIREERIGNMTVRVYTPSEGLSGAGLLWIHGGGYIMGRAAMDDPVCVDYARDLGLVVVSVEYRLAPRFPFPAALDDCYEAWQWFLRHAPGLGVDPNRIVVAGQSAGGGLTASLTQRIHDTDGIQPVAQVLFCPMLDDRTAANATLDAINHRVWNNSNNRMGWSSYLGQAPGQPHVPNYAVPARRENLTGLVPAWIGVGDIDLFHEEDYRYAERLVEQGVETHLHVAPMAPHAFERFAPKAPITQILMASNYRFLTAKLGL
ncbi:MAG TPA: alpha/beta hydrolase [Dongiaceae bacterium]|nr:alpha/beta hydrolase [Dongiaceae bacterium]